MKAKKRFYLAAILALAFVFAACGGGLDDSDDLLIEGMR
jgi:hypothetical protein